MTTIAIAYLYFTCIAIAGFIGQMLADRSYGKWKLIRRPMTMDEAGIKSLKEYRIQLAVGALPDIEIYDRIEQETE